MIIDTDNQARYDFYMDIKHLPADRIVARHEVRDQDKLAELVASMASKGWEGRPLLVSNYRALTGSHRLAAAEQLGIEVPVVEVPGDWDWTTAYDDESLLADWQEYVEYAEEVADATEIEKLLIAG